MSSEDRELFEPSDIMGALYGDGVLACPAAFNPGFADVLHEDILALMNEARTVPGGTLPRGPERWYVEVQPERVRGFVAITTHPWFVAVCEAVLGPDYRIVEVGFDIPYPGAADQPWHRDFAAPDATSIGRRLNSLAFNLTAVDTLADMGPFEIAPGTQWDAFGGCDKGMFPPRELWPRYVARARRSLPKRGDMSARSALTISPRHGEPVDDGAPGARRRRRRARCDQRRASRLPGDAPLSRQPAGARARSPDLPRRRHAGPRRSKSRHRWLDRAHRLRRSLTQPPASPIRNYHIKECRR